MKQKYVDSAIFHTKAAEAVRRKIVMALGAEKNEEITLPEEDTKKLPDIAKSILDAPKFKEKCVELFGSETVAKEKGVHDIVKMAVAEYVDSFYLEHKAREATNKAYRGEFFPPDTYTSRAALSLNNYCRAYTNHVSNRTESALEDICPGNPEDAYYLHCQIIKVVRACELSFPHGTGIKPNPPASFQVEPGKTFAQQHLSDIRKYWHQEQDDAKYWKDDLNEKDALRVTGWQQKEDAREKTAKEHGNPDGPGFF